MSEYFKLWLTKELTEIIVGLVIVVIIIIVVIIAQNIDGKGKK